MKWTVLGFHSPYPGPGGATPGYLLETNQGTLLIDCGSGVASQLAKYMNPWELDGIVLSHLHNDHMVDVPILHYAFLVARLQNKRMAPMPIYSPVTPPELAERLLYKDYVHVSGIDPQAALSIAGIQIQFVRTEHEIECYAMKITEKDKMICYTADAGPNTDWALIGHQADLLVVEGTYLQHDVPAGPRGHLTIAEAAQLAQKLQAKKCLITHLYPAYQRDDILKEARPYYDGELYLAEMGLKLEV